jgi:hypothetical protein
MTLSDVLRELIQRLGSEGDTVLTWEQVRQWPKGAIANFEKAGWIEPTVAATTVECSGCAENCFKPVHVLPSRNGQPARAYVACNEPPAMGRVKIHLSRLQQWQVTHAQVARWLASALGFKGKPARDSTSGIIALGQLQGKKVLRVVEFDTVAPVSLKASGHSRPLSEVVDFESGHPRIDRQAILDMVDLPPPAESAARYQASTARRDSRKLDTQAMYESWGKAYREQKKKHPNMSDVWYSRQIAKTDIAKGRNAGTIKKNMKS